MKTLARAAAAAVLLLACAHLAWAQEGILHYAIDPVIVDVAPGGRAAARLTMTNASPYEADEVEVSWSGPEGFSLEPAPDVVPVVDPFASASVVLAISPRPTAPLGETRGTVEILYSYCIGDLCYQIVESAPVALRVVAQAQTAPVAVGGTTGEPTPVSPTFPWLWIGFGAAAALVVPALFVRRPARLRALVFVLLVAASGTVLGLGVSLGQHKQAQAIGAVLCTSCVGIETVETLAPRLSAAQATTVDRLTVSVELLVFYAPWCRSCPYAEALVDLIASRNPLVRYRLVNAEQERDLAVEYGVTRSGRTVVPAIVRMDTGEILFGAENLGNRLVKLLGVGA
jgi:thiol-disulfide isomerase/thioredoxin